MKVFIIDETTKLVVLPDSTQFAVKTGEVRTVNVTVEGLEQTSADEFLVSDINNAVANPSNIVTDVTTLKVLAQLVDFAALAGE